MLELVVEVVGATGSALGALLPYLLGLAAVAVLVVARAGAVLQPHRPAPPRDVTILDLTTRDVAPGEVAPVRVAPTSARRRAALVA